MNLLRLILVALAVYYFWRLIKRILQPAQKNPNIKGKGAQERTQKSNMEIEDADYEEIE
jgi:hypothetical protein